MKIFNLSENTLFIYLCTSIRSFLLNSSQAIVLNISIEKWFNVTNIYENLISMLGYYSP